MTIPQTIEAIEARARTAGMTVDEFCKGARIDRATWQRWKAGKTKPSFDAWSRVMGRAESLTKPPRSRRKPAPDRPSQGAA